MTSAREGRIDVGGVVFGAVVFLAAHVVLLALWRRWLDPGGAYQVWFLNTGRAVALTVAWLLAASFVGALYAPPRPGQAARRVLGVALGAMAAMAAVLFVTGPGTIFPIVLVIGAAIVAAAVAAGTYAAALARARPGRRS